MAKEWPEKGKEQERESDIKLRRVNSVEPMRVANENEL